MKVISIKWKIMLAYAVAFISVIVLGFILFNSIYDIMKNSASRYTVQIIEKVKYDLEIMVRELDGAVLLLSNDPDVKELAAGNKDPWLKQKVDNKIQNAIKNLSKYDGLSCDILILSKNLEIVSSSYEEWTGKYRILGYEWIDKIISAGGDKVLISGYNVNKTNSLPSAKVTSIARALPTMEGGSSGIVMIEVTTDYLKKLCNGVGIGRNGFVAVVDDNNYVIYNTNTTEIGSRFNDVEHSKYGKNNYFIGDLNNERMLFAQVDSFYTGFKVIGAVPEEELASEINTLRDRFIIIVGFIVLFAILFSYIMAHSITRPVMRMCKYMKSVGKGDFSIRIESMREDEIGQLEKGFNTMVKKVNELIDSEYKATIREKEAQFNELVATINPHFMYNTLEAISMTAYLNDDMKVVNMLNLLADLLRTSTSNGSRIIPIKQEIFHLECYLQLLNIRNDDNLDIIWNIDKELMDYKTMKFILQPVVENSIIHGFKNSSEGGRIEISLVRVGEKAKFIISDNGMGIAQERLDEINKILDAPEMPMDTPQMAMKNVHDRLRLAFGKDYGVTLYNNPDCGTTVEIMIPLCK